MTVPQKMLAHANKRVLARKAANQLDEKYRTAVLKAPGLVKSCGLVQALAFFEAKKAKEEGYRHLLEDLQGMPNVGTITLESVSELSTADYMRTTLRVLDALGYLKRMVEAHKEDKAEA